MNTKAYLAAIDDIISSTVVHSFVHANSASAVLRLYGSMQGRLSLHRLDHRPNVTHQGAQRRHRGKVLPVPNPGDVGVRAGMSLDE